MSEGDNLEEAVLKIERLLKWFETEANIDKALSSDGGPIEQRRRAVEYIKQIAQLLPFIKDKAMNNYPDKILEIEENYKYSVESVEAFNKIISDNDLNAARAFHLSQDNLNRMLNNVSGLIRLVKPMDDNPLILKILELKQRVEYLEAERYQLLVELRRLKGGEEPILEVSPFHTASFTPQNSLQQELEKLRKEKESLEQQLSDLREGEKSIAYQSLLKENSELRERTTRLTEALKITRARNENRFKQLLQERDEWRSKALEKTVHSIEETMYELRNQIENLKKENQQLKQKLNLLPQKEKEDTEIDHKYDYHGVETRF